ncbi:MAG: beta-ureidopropionase [Armatimonadetes bacterium]|nr:beta-ureidopropionase [Armatimonadota bacterium]
MHLNIACAQTAPRKAEVARNLDEVVEIILQCESELVDLVVFPEASLSGYFLEGGVFEASLTGEQLTKELASRLSGKLKRPIDAVIGFYEREEGSLYNSAAYFELSAEGAFLKQTYRKFFLPTYGVFDEERFVSRGLDLGIVETRFGKVGLLICEDIWHSILPLLLAVHGCQLIVVPSASPGRGFSGETVANLARYQRLLTAVSEEHGVFCANCQLCGFEGGKGFVGGSMIIDPMGKRMAESPVAEPHLLITDIDLSMIELARAQSPLISDLRSTWSRMKELVEESPN